MVINKKGVAKVFLTFIFSVFLFASKTSFATAVSCAEPSSSGDYTVDPTTSCSFARTIDGVDNGNITIATDKILQIDDGTTIVWNSGRSITINGIIALAGTGQISQGDLYAVDEDADGYGKSTTADTTDYPEFFTTGGANRVRVSTLVSRENDFGDCQDTNIAAYTCLPPYSEGAYYTQSTYYRQSSYYRYSESTYYRYSQAAYYRYSQGTYYRYAQGTYYRQASYYTSACFTGKTKVAMANGSFKEIRDIKAGDIVVSYNLKTGKKTYETVTKLIIHPDTAGGYLVINGTLEITPNHLVWSPSKNNWVAISDLKIGDSLLNSSGITIRINSIDKVNGVNTVYNLSLLGPNHNFFTEDFLVHNHKVGLAR